MKRLDFKIGHLGDTGPLGDMRLTGETYKPDRVRVPEPGPKVDR